MAFAAAGCPPLWRELLTASPLISSSPIDLCLHLGEHRSLRGGEKGPGWPAWLSSAIVAAPVCAGVARRHGRCKEELFRGLFCLSADYRNRPHSSRVNKR